MFFYIKKSDDPLFMEYIDWLNNLPNCSGRGNGKFYEYYYYDKSNKNYNQDKKYHLEFMDSAPIGKEYTEVSLSFWDTCLRSKSPEEISEILKLYKSGMATINNTPVSYTGNWTKQFSTGIGTVTSSLSDSITIGSGTSITTVKTKGRYDAMVSLI